MNERYRLTVYAALLLTFLADEVISLARVDYSRPSNATHNNNWNYGGAGAQNPQQGSRYPPANGNSNTYPGQYGSGQGQQGQYGQGGSGYPNYTSPQYGSGQGQQGQHGQWGSGYPNNTSPQFRPTNKPNQTPHYYPGQNPQAGNNWNQYNASRPTVPSTNWRPPTNSSWQQQPNSNWRPPTNNSWQQQPNSNWRPPTNVRVTPTTPSSYQNNNGWNSNSNVNNYNSSSGGGQGFMNNLLKYGANSQNQTNPGWSGGSHLYPNLQPDRPNQYPQGNNGGAALAPMGGSNSYNNQWNGNRPNSADGGAAHLAPIGGGGPTGSNGVPLAPLGTGNQQWNAGGGQAGLSYGYGNGQQSNSYGGAGQQRPGGPNTYSNMFN